MLHCKIEIFNPPEEFFRPLQKVNGIIRYTAFEGILLKKIVVSLKGIGVLKLEGRRRRKFKETYINIEKNVKENPAGFLLEEGVYEEQFSFELPENIPTSIKTRQNASKFNAVCRIEYYVRIKFIRRYLLKTDITFKKHIIVKPVIITNSSLEPVKYEKFKELKIKQTSFFGTIRLVAAVEKPVVYERETITLYYELENNTNTRLTNLLTSLLEVYRFKPKRPLIHSKSFVDMENTKSMTGPIGLGETVTNAVNIEVPADAYSLQNSSLVTRQYYVKVVVQLPPPHSDLILKIPIQIVAADSSSNAEITISSEDNISRFFDVSRDTDVNEIVEEDTSMMIDEVNDNDRGTRNIVLIEETRYTNVSPRYSRPPPSYWESMGCLPSVEDDKDGP